MILPYFILFSIFVASLLASLCPRMINNNPKVSNLVAVIGAGYLIGVSMLVLLPESVEAFVHSFRNVKKDQIFSSQMGM